MVKSNKIKTNTKSNKVKTNKAIAKRFRVTKTGKVISKSPGLNHKTGKKSSKRKRSLSQGTRVEGAMKKKILRNLGK
ncbi:50S ribosomal protein L35 [bacterium]|nr:50S ribosomal protein L35 [bacterium]|tara:strand:+ start:1110 stop:1340 length:231 start_codon:yes stop_codon:yes gene_type:complete